MTIDQVAHKTWKHDITIKNSDQDFEKVYQSLKV